MDKTKIQKVNKAVVATVFAASGMTVVVPPPQKALAATSPFIDIDQYNSHYENIIKLYKQGAIGGYPDKTFRPNQNVTRGQAAKMLATVLDLNLKNLENPYFTDVPTSNEYYKYIAALENAGIMSGYSNGKFMPNEIITRGQLAKILVLGFKFEVSTNFHHNFKDVNNQTSNAAYIQTLVDLKITEGTTPVTFSPYNPLTRGQIASFIIRAQDKQENPTSYKITSIKGNTVYINAVPYTVSTNLSNILNEGNGEVLKGAVIEGTLINGNISYVSKLTLNASGTYKNYLELKGSNSSFGASIVVNGNYIRFADVNLTGTVFINETVRPPLIMNAFTNNSLGSLGRVASTNLRFIDWSNPNQPEDVPSQGSASDELQNWTNENNDSSAKDDPKKDDPFVNWTKDRIVMENVEKYVAFYNSTISHLIVSQNATRIDTNKTLPRVDIRGNVEKFEILGNITTLNLNTESKFTMYGESNISRINYYSYTDLELYFDGRVGTLYVDNSYGWIDIGDYTYIDKVILPKDEGPNNIFDDFLVDKDNIGNITDPDGKPVDKNDIENQKPADKTKPIVTITNLELLSGSNISFDFTSTKVGTYYYIIREKDADPPTKSEMVNRVSSTNAASGTGSAAVGKNTIKVSNLGEKKEYVLYVMVVDGAKNVSDLANKSFQMKDGSPPVVKSLTVQPLHGGKRAEMKFVASEPGEYYYVVRPKTSAPDPTTKDIIAKPTGKGVAKSGELGITEILKGLMPETTYQIYVVMKDNSGNLSIDPPISKEFTTTAPDNEHPYIQNPKLERADKANQFYVYFNEALDPETARNVQNYDLSGTVIVNTTNQQRIKPSAVEYKAGDKKVLLTIPSETGFVLGDTLRVTVLPGVKDLADNEFENATTVKENEPVRNYAEYLHENEDKPDMSIENVVRKPDESDGYSKVEVEFKPSKAGTYYYMVLPDTVKDGDVSKSFTKYLEEKGITSRDFVNEFDPENKLHSGYFQLGNDDIYIVKGNGPATLEAKTQKFPISIPKDKLNPFVSYSVYMVLKDRGGELSEIKWKSILGDSKAPLIKNLEIKPKLNDDTRAEVKFSTDETTLLHYWVVPKKNEDGTENLDAKWSITTEEKRKELEEILRSKPDYKTTGSGEGRFEITGLTPHSDYVVYFGAEDTYGNMTIYSSNAAGDGHETTAAGWMKKDLYSDGTAPKIAVGEQPWIKKITKLEFDTITQNPLSPDSMTYSEDKTFVVSFSESLNITDAELLAALNTKLNGTSATISQIEWEDTTTIKTWQSRKLLIQFDQKVLSDFTIDMNQGTTVVKDFAGLTFDKPLGEFKYQNMPGFGISGAGLVGNLTMNTSLPATSNRIQIIYTANGRVHNPKYYFVMSNTNYDLTSGTNALTKQHIIAGIDPENNLAFDVKGSNIMSGNSLLDIRLWADNLIGTSNQPEKVFIENKYIYMVLLDDYGNTSEIAKAAIIKP